MSVYTPPIHDDLERLILLGFDFNDESNYDLEALEFTPAQPQTQYVGGPDTEGELPVDGDRWSNAELQMRIRAVRQPTADAARAKLRAIAAVLLETYRGGGADLEWIPNNGAETTTWTCLRGFINGIPIVTDGNDTGWLLRTPVINVRLVLRPFGRGTEYLEDALTSTLPIITREISPVPGDVAAEGRLLVTDNATQNRDHVEWGMELLDEAGGPSLYALAANLSEQAASVEERDGSIGDDVLRIPMTPSYQPAGGWDGIENVGRFRVRARIYLPVTDAAIVRLGYRTGDAPLRHLQPVSNVAGGWQEVDLGVVNLARVRSGVQSSDLRIEAKRGGVPNWGDISLDLDTVMLIPVDYGYGKARAAEDAALNQAITSYNARDEFNQSAGNLNTKTAPVGGNWATAGGSGDFEVHADHYLTRYSTEDASARRAIIGDSIADQIVWVQFHRSDPHARQGVIARFVSATSRYVYAYYEGGEINVYKVTSAGTSLLRRLAVLTTTQFVALAIYSDGRFKVWNGLISAAGQDDDLATGGELEEGAAGIYDFNPYATPNIRTYDNFAFLGAEQVHALNATRSLEVRSDGAYRWNPDNTLLGDVPVYRGSHFYVPPGGLLDKVPRVAVKARRGDVDETADLGPTDSTRVRVAITPRYLFPR